MWMDGGSLRDTPVFPWWRNNATRLVALLLLPLFTCVECVLDFFFFSEILYYVSDIYVQPFFLVFYFVFARRMVGEILAVA